MEVLHDHILRVASNSPVHIISSWPSERVRPYGWHQYLLRTFGVRFDGSAYLIFDGDQMIYWDVELWNDIFGCPGGKVAGVIVLATYGSPASVFVNMLMPFIIEPAQLVSMSHHDNGDGTGEAGLLLTRTEFNMYIKLKCSTNCFTEAFLDQLHKRTDGHIGAIERLLQLITITPVYLLLPYPPV